MRAAHEAQVMPCTSDPGHDLRRQVLVRGIEGDDVGLGVLVEQPRSDGFHNSLGSEVALKAVVDEGGVELDWRDAAGHAGGRGRSSK